MATDWREIARRLWQALVEAPVACEWERFLAGDAEAKTQVDEWSFQFDEVHERYRAAEHDAMCDDLFNAAAGQQPGPET